MRHSESPLPGFVLLLRALVQTVGFGAARAEDLPVVDDVDLQPLAAEVLRVVEALDILGQPLAPADKAKLDKELRTSGFVATWTSSFLVTPRSWWCWT